MAINYRRRTDSDETWNRLKEWVKGQKSAERLAGHILQSEGFSSIDPSHPLGGRDGGKDFLCLKEGLKWVGAVYFPRGQQSFNAIKTKFQADFDGVTKNQADAFVFVTNQELSVSERKELMMLHLDYRIEVYHLERIVNILNAPSNYGVRLEFLDIEVTPEEQLAYFAERDKTFYAMIEKFDKFTEAQMMKHDDEEEEECEDRSVEEISRAIAELLDKVWYDRHLSLKFRVRTGQETVDPEIWKGALKSARAVVRRYGRENLGPWTDFEWGMLNGKLSALRWVLGDDWDMLDT